jgi:uncharacterized membrane protein YebE (DUF533 family)
MAAFLTTIGTAIGLSGTAATIGGAAAVGAAAYGVKSFLTPKEPKAPDIQPLPQAPSLESAEVAAKEDVDRKRRAIARNRTIYTDPLGLSPAEKSGIALKTLTGQ